jgi:hypothetical protein
VIYNSLLATTVVSIVFAAGCDKAIDDQVKANNAQTEANNTVDAIKKEADQKIVTAQAGADKTASAANANFMKLREDFRHLTTTISSTWTTRSRSSKQTWERQ